MGLALTIAVLAASPPVHAHDNKHEGRHEDAREAAATNTVLLDDAIRSELSALAVLRGGDIDIKSLSGKFVVVSFFASWCVPCRAEFIEMRKLIETMGSDKIKVVTINWLEDFTHYPSETLQIFRVLDRLDPHITAIEGTKNIARRFGGERGIRAIPALFAFDPAGAMVYRFQFGAGLDKSHTTAADLLAAFQ